MRHFQLIPAAVLFCLAASNADARDIFVNNLTGADYSDGRTPERVERFVGPLRSIGRALEICEKGDRIILAGTDEPYRECISLCTGRHSGTSELRPFTIVGNGAILDGTAAIPPEAWEQYRGNIWRFSPTKKTYQQVFLDGRPVPRAPGGPILDDDAFPPLTYQRDYHYVYFCTEPLQSPVDYDLAASAMPAAITLYHVRNVRIEDLIVQGYRLDGINAHDGVYNCTLEGITARGNGRSGISIGGSSQVEVVDCLSGDNGTVQLRTEGRSRAELINTVLLDNTGPAYAVQGGRLIIDGQDIERE